MTPETFDRFRRVVRGWLSDCDRDVQLPQTPRDTERRQAERTVIAFPNQTRLFMLDTSLSRTEPCPLCTLLYLSSDTVSVSDLLHEPFEVSESLIDDIRSGAVDHIREYIVSPDDCGFGYYDAENGKTYLTTRVTAHPACLYPHSETDDVAELDPNSVRTALLDPACGVLRSLSKRRIEVLDGFPDDYFVAATTVTDPAVRASTRKETIKAGGCGSTEHDAEIRAVMEGFERFGLFSPLRPERIGSRRDFADNCVRPKALFHDSDGFTDRQGQSALEGFRSTQPWISGTELSTDEEALLPAEFASLNVLDQPQSERIVEGSSNGCAAHFDENAATRNAVLELFERDACMRFWYGHSGGVEIPKRLLSSESTRILSAMERADFSVTLLDISQRRPFYVVTTYVRDENRQITVLSGGCGTTHTDAVSKSLREAFDMLATMTDGMFGQVTDRQCVTTPEDHLLFYQEGDPAAVLNDLMIDNETLTEFCTTPPTSRFEELLPAGIEIYAVDITPDVLSRRGVSVIQSVSPSLVPISFGNDNRRLTSSDEVISENQPDGYPHPYP